MKGCKTEPTMAKKVISDIIGQRQQRVFKATRAAAVLDEAARTVEMALTSDEPIFHGFAYIILDHSPKSINLERFQGGAPLLEGLVRALRSLVPA